MPDGDAESEPGDVPGDAGDDLHALLKKLQHLVDPRAAFQAAEGPVGAAWRSVTREEPRVQVTAAVLVAIGLILALPARVANHPRWLLPALAAPLLLGVFVAKSARAERRARAIQVVSLSLIAVMSISNAASGARLVVDLARGVGINDGVHLLLTGGDIWLTNVIVFGLWYWAFDRGGSVERAAGTHQYPDLLFAQMTSPELAPPDWEPGFVDYLYVSFTNALAFSPTDVLPMTRWAKLTMLTQSLVSVTTIALVIARAVNVLG